MMSTLGNQPQVDQDHAYGGLHSGQKRPSSSRTVGRLESRRIGQRPQPSMRLKSAHHLRGSTRVKGNKPITNGATDDVHTVSQRTVCLKIWPNFHRFARSGSKNLGARIRMGPVSGTQSYDEKMRRMAASRIGVTTMRADLDGK